MQKTNNSTLNINEIFGPTIQGEGRLTGIPAIFVRLNGCNLRCCFGKPGASKPTSICDTAYSSIHPEPSKKFTIESLTETVHDLMGKIGGTNKQIVITGGEPMLQQDALEEFLTEYEDGDGWERVTIETNGTIIPNDKMYEHDIFWSISPKLSTSCCFEGSDIPEAQQELHKKTRINYKALASIITSPNEYQLKFVYSNEESVKEIKEIIAKLKDYIMKNMPTYFFEAQLIDENIMLMPEGMTNEQITKSSVGAVQACIENGWRFCDRLHIRIWGDKRAV